MILFLLFACAPWGTDLSACSRACQPGQMESYSRWDGCVCQVVEP